MRRPDRSAEPDERTKAWGGVARRGAGRLRDPRPGSASDAWRRAASEGDRDRGAPAAWEPEEWVDAGPVRDEAEAAVARGATSSTPPKRRRRKELPEDVEEEVARAAGPQWAARVRDRLNEATAAYEAERFRDAKRILEALLERAPTAVAVRELYGLTLYRMGRWREAARELGAVELMTGSVEHHPVIADCHRALKQYDRVTELWDELRRGGASTAAVIEGRIVTAGALADRRKVPEAIALLEQGPVEVKRPHEHHLRLWYALAALYERSGDVTRARALFGRVAQHAPAFADAAERAAGLGG